MTLAHCPTCDLWIGERESCLHIPAYGFGENAERHSISTTAADPLLKMAVAARGVGAVPHPPGLGSTRLFSPSDSSELPL